MPRYQDLYQFDSLIGLVQETSASQDLVQARVWEISVVMEWEYIMGILVVGTSFFFNYYRQRLRGKSAGGNDLDL